MGNKTMLQCSESAFECCRHVNASAEQIMASAVVDILPATMACGVTGATSWRAVEWKSVNGLRDQDTTDNSRRCYRPPNVIMLYLLLTRYCTLFLATSRVTDVAERRVIGTYRQEPLSLSKLDFGVGLNSNPFVLVLW